MTIKKVGIDIETAYRLYELGFIVIVENDTIYLAREKED